MPDLSVTVAGRRPILLIRLFAFGFPLSVFGVASVPQVFRLFLYTRGNSLFFQ